MKKSCLILVAGIASALNLSAAMERPAELVKVDRVKTVDAL